MNDDNSNRIILQNEEEDPDNINNIDNNQLVLTREHPMVWFEGSLP